MVMQIARMIRVPAGNDLVAVHGGDETNGTWMGRQYRTTVFPARARVCVCVCARARVCVCALHTYIMASPFHEDKERDGTGRGGR
jgi:hypothetical protein